MTDALYILLFLVAAFIAARIAMLVVIDRWSRLKERRRKR